MEGEVRLRPREFFQDLQQSELRYLLVGRQALVLLGAPLLSSDFDFYISPEPDDLKTLLGIARRRRLEVTVKDPAKKPFFSLLADDLKLDFFRSRRYGVGPSSFTFDELFERRQVIPLGKVAVYLPSTEDLLKTKLARGSPKDREDIKYLQVLLEREQRAR